MKKIFTIITLLAAVQTLSATPLVDEKPESENKEKATKNVLTHTFGGRIDIMLYSDTHFNVASKNGLQFIAPNQPNINAAGDDLNIQNMLRISAAPTRFSYLMTASNTLGGTLKGLIEVDFMDASTTMIRMRHAYLNLEWSKNSLLIGQTSHLTMPSEATPNTVSYGSGYPMFPLNRPVQVQYRQNFGEFSNLTAAAAIFGGTTGEMQGFTMVPDLQLKFTTGIKNFAFGVFGGVKITQPRVYTTLGEKASEVVTAFDAGAFAKFDFAKGCALKLYGLWGQDMSHMAVLGGYAPLKSEYASDDNYGYGKIAGLSTFADFETGVSKKGWQWGIFAGFQQNLGSNDEIAMPITVFNYLLDNFWRVSPRVYFHANKNLSFGAEYMLSGARWMKTYDSNYKGDEYYDPTINHRFTFLARFKF